MDDDIQKKIVLDAFSTRVKKFQKLMRFKIREILLVSSLYDNYLFEEDGRLYELIREEYQSLNLSHAPEITHVTTSKEAIELLLQENQFDLILTTMHVEDMHVVQFAQEIKSFGIKIPIILLAYDNQERKEIENDPRISIFERIFIWQGDYKLLIGIIKSVEDRINVERDTKAVGVQVVILVEDDVKFYSAYLPLIYTEIFKQSQRLISEGVNASHRFLRMRARPKILLCTTFEEAWDYFEKYKQNILGVISDINFLHNGVKDPEAGIKLAKRIKSVTEDVPVLLQSTQEELKETAYKIGASFLLKGSPRLLNDLRKFMIENFSFGDFVFKTPDGKRVGHAANLRELAQQLEVVPIESILYHSERNHFSTWLKARTEFWLANQLRPRKISDFESPEALRSMLLASIKHYLELRQQGTITEFTKETFDPKNSFAKIGYGSLGGKARGLGFINNLISNLELSGKFKGIDIYVPAAVVLATDIYDRFIEENDLFDFAINEQDDSKIVERFILAEKFPSDVTVKLMEFLHIVKVPLAVRSSSLLEDSQFQPFAGVYETFMIPNQDEDLEERLEELLLAIKLVYASTFFKRAKDYLKATSYRLEEEKMAVIIQKIVGAHYENRFYPNISGVAKSYNFYPIPPQKATDGIAHVALGLGKIIVEGGNSIRFCPKYPKHLLQFYSTKETLRNTQQKFYALDLSADFSLDNRNLLDNLVKEYELDVAEKDGTLANIASTYSQENEAIYDGLSRNGMRLVTFAPILKHNIIPLPAILDTILHYGSWGMGTQVEIEFAMNTKVPKGEPMEFALLQMRPMVLSRESIDLDLKNVKNENLICRSSQVLGDGIIEDVYDIVVVDADTFDRAKSKDVALEISKFNEKLTGEKKPYILIGVGRWGSMDPWLGIPVTWDQISGASVIVESSFKDFKVEPSQGSHFFHNITAFRIGYFTIKSNCKNCFVDWKWLKEQKETDKFEFTRHLVFDKPLITKISGKQNEGVIIKPGMDMY